MIPDGFAPIISVHEGSVAMESQLIALAGWMRKNYGSTMNQALKTVLPIRRQTKEVQKREIVLLIPKTEAQQKLALFEQKHYTAKSKAAAGTDTGIRTGLFACHRKTEYISSSDPGYGTAADS